MSSPRSTQSQPPRCKTSPRAVLLPVLTLISLSCSDERPSPMGPGQTAELVTAAAAPLAFRQITAGLSHACGVTTTNVAYCWGRNNAGQLGDGSTTQRLRPTAAAGGLTFKAVTAGTIFSCGIASDDHAYCWGNNQYGQLGDGGTTTHSSPTPAVGPA